jgi:hypothetical protein
MMLRAAATLSLAASATAWNDIAGALTYKGTSHVFQVGPRPALPSETARQPRHPSSSN